MVCVPGIRVTKEYYWPTTDYYLPSHHALTMSNKTVVRETCNIVTYHSPGQQAVVENDPSLVEELEEGIRIVDYLMFKYLPHDWP